MKNKFIPWFVISNFALSLSEAQVFYNPGTNDTNYYEIRAKLLADPPNQIYQNEEGGPQADIRRWDIYWNDRLFPLGSFKIANEAIYDYVNAQYNTTSQQGPVQTNIAAGRSDWHCIGPTGDRSNGTNGAGNGQCQRINFDPDDPEHLWYASGLGAGLWQSDNTSVAGWQWHPISDNLPFSGASDVVVVRDPANSFQKVWLLASGPGDGVSLCTGVYRSTDAGVHWTPINNGIYMSYRPFMNIQRMVGDPSDPNVLFATTNDGIYKTANALDPNPSNVLWQKVYPSLGSAPFKGFEFMPGTPSTAYASGTDIYVSTMNGQLGSWVSMTGLGTGLEFGAGTFSGHTVMMINIATTPAPGFSNYVYATIVSRDASNVIHHHFWVYDGSQWQQKLPITTTYLDPFSPAWLAIAVYPFDGNRVFLGSAVPVRTYDMGNNNMSECGATSIHPDIHDLKFTPGGQLLAACDGGIYKLNNPLAAICDWDSKNPGLQAALVYRISDSPNEPDLLLTGEQDNGRNIYDNRSSPVNPWTQLSTNGFGSTHSGDGGSNVFSNDPCRYYITELGGTEPTREYQNCATTTSDWGTPTGAYGGGFPPMYYKKSSEEYYIARSYVAKADGLAPLSSLTLWDKLSSFEADYSSLLWSSNGCGIVIGSMAFAESNPDVIYIASIPRKIDECTGTPPPFDLPSLLFKTTQGGGEQGNCPNPNSYGSCWDFLPINLPGGSVLGAITGIAISSTNPDKVWVSFSGYDPNIKVLKTTDGGLNWQNETDNLPNLPVNSIAFENGSDDGIYVGTDAGVYYHSNKSTQWEKYNDMLTDLDPLPNAIINSIVMNYTSNKIRVGTYGRGVWESKFVCPLDDDLVLPHPNANDFYEAKYTIASTESYTSTPNLHVNYRAGNEITLSPDFSFTATTNSAFTAFIHRCDQPGNSSPMRIGSLSHPGTSFKTEKPIVSFDVFPNPNQGSFTIKMLEENNLEKSITVMDLVGKTIWKSDNNFSSETTINISGNPRGIYFVKVTYGDSSEMKKIVFI